jgi:hypothetical protein
MVAFLAAARGSTLIAGSHEIPGIRKWSAYDERPQKRDVNLD